MSALTEACIYCDGRSGDSQFSLEHIWPAGLGGAACPDIFKTRQVCRRCNSLMGQWVDGPLLKSWFFKNEVGLNAHLYLDPEKPGVIPPFYVGVDGETPVDPGDVCERWIGAAGAHIYHFHKQDDDRWSAVAGGDFIRRKVSDPGRAYIVLTTNSQYWAMTALLSFVAHFPEAQRRTITDVVGLPSSVSILPANQEPLSDAERREVAFIRGRPDGKAHMAHIPVQIDFSERFLAKVSVGLAHTILGRRAMATSYIKRLRELLWSRDVESRESLGIQGVGFWQGEQLHPRFKQMIGWEGAWTIFLKAFDQAFGLVISTPGGRTMVMNISDEPSSWAPNVMHDYGPGVIYVVIPERAKAFGPIPFPEYLNHKLGHSRHPDLVSIESMKTDRSKLPPMEQPGRAN